MEISNQLVEVLDNFAKVNPSIIIRPGSVVRTIDVDHTIMGAFDYDGEEFKEDIGIYSIKDFLNTIKLFESPSLNIDSDVVSIKDNKSSAVFRLTEPELIQMDNDREGPNVEEFVRMTLDTKDINTLRNAASTVGVYKMVFKSLDNEVEVTLLDEDNPLSSEFQIRFDAECQEGFAGSLDIELFNKLMKGDYDVVISENGLSKFKHKEKPLNYWIRFND